MMIKANQIEKKLFFLLGLFTSMALIQIPVGSSSITAFNFILYIIVFFNIAWKRELFFPKNSACIFFLYLICLTISTIFNSFLLPNSWMKASITTLINTFFLSYILVFFGAPNLQIVKKDFIAGLKLSTRIQLVWGIIQYVLYRATGQSLNQIIFSKIPYIAKNFPLTSTYNEIFRLTGLNWEPAYFGLALIIGYLLAEKWWLKLSFVVVIFLSTSRTSIICLVVILLIQLIVLIFGLRKGYKKNIKINYFILSLLVLIILGFFIVFNWSNINEVLANIIVRFSNLSSDGSTFTHVNYYKKLGDILFHKFNVFQLLFGNTASGLPYTVYYGIYLSLINRPWGVENGLVNALVANGLLGTVCIYMWFVFNVIHAKKNKVAVYLIIAILVGSISYSYFVNWVWIVVLFISLPKNGSNFIDVIERKNIVNG